jgi:arylsulfatase A-like enzyme
MQLNRVVCLACLLSLINVWSVNAVARPNIIFFLSDDHRNDTLSCAGHPIVQTPTIDRLAKHGVRFSNAFVTTSICAASRASYLTSLYERTHGFTFGTGPLRTEFVQQSYPAVLKRAGYRTGFVGKFGIGTEPGSKATQIMFDEFSHLKRPYLKGNKHLTQRIGDWAVDFIDRQDKSQPFCLSVSFNAGHAEDKDKENHYPYPETVAHLYSDMEMPLPKLGDPAIFDELPEFMQESLNRNRYYWRWDTPGKYQHNMRNYFRLISALDYEMNRVLEKLDEKGLADNTVVIFSGDNGYYMGDRGFAGKWSHFEESLRVPLVVYDPRLKKEQQGRVDESTVLNLDVPATILDAAGVEIPHTYQGRSLSPLLMGMSPDWRTDYFCEHLMDVPAIPKWEGVRGERYTYAKYFEQQPVYEFLFDLKNDPDQLHNLAQSPEHAELLKIMRSRTIALRDTYGGKFAANPKKKGQK